VLNTEHTAPNECMDTLPRNRASQEPMGHHRGMKPGRSPEFCVTLKLLAPSVVRRRNVPPFSKVSKQWPRSYALASDVPSRAPSPLFRSTLLETDVNHPESGGPQRSGAAPQPASISRSRALFHNALKVNECNGDFATVISRSDAAALPRGHVRNSRLAACTFLS
jgi:hypothetical protein